MNISSIAFSLAHNFLPHKNWPAFHRRCWPAMHQLLDGEGQPNGMDSDFNMHKKVMERKEKEPRNRSDEETC
jgi:hypothetical protein